MAKVHKKHSELKADMRKASLRMAADIALMVGIVFGVLTALILQPDWLMVLRIGPVNGLGLLGIAAAIAMVVLEVRRRLNLREAAVRRAGVQGEENALAQLREALPAGYMLFTNVRIMQDTHESEMDLVAVGPGGVSVVEVKNYAGLIRGKAADKELTHVNGSRREQVYNPLLQVGTHVRRLNDYLYDRGLDAKVRGYVYFVHPRADVRIESGRGERWFTLEETSLLAQRLCGSSEKLPKKQIEGVCQVLRKA